MEETKLPYCDKCGAEISEDAVYCPKCGNEVVWTGEGYVELATWTQRFIALIIDGIILGVITGIMNIPGYRFIMGIDVSFSATRVLPFLYFMLMDYYYGQTIGRKVMNLKITKVGRAQLTFIDAAIESFGKVFLLPIDFLVGYFMYRKMNQRLFNYLSDTVVIRED